MVRLGYKPKHRTKFDYISFIRGEYRTLINWIRYFAFKNK